MTSSSLTSLLILAFTAAASPFSLVAFSLVLATDRGPRNGIAFICGWVTTVTLIGVAVALLGSNVEVTSSNTPGKLTLSLELAIGVALITVWVRRRLLHIVKERPVQDPPKPEPAWQRRISTMGYLGTFVTSGAVQTWPVMIAAGTTIVRLDITGPAKLAWMFVFALATTPGLIVLEVLAWRNPTSAVDRLQRLRTYISSHKDSVLNWVYLIAGLWLFFHALLGLLL